MINEFFVFLDQNFIGCSQCNSDKKTYVVYDYYDFPYGFWCKECWYEKLSEIGNVLKNDSERNMKIGRILQSYKND